MTLINVLIPWTVAIYLGFFFIFGEEIFTTDFAADEGSGGFLDGILSFFDTAFDLVGDLAQFITLGGFTSPLHPVVQTILLLTVGLGWFIVVLGLARGTPSS